LCLRAAYAPPEPPPERKDIVRHLRCFVAPLGLYVRFRGILDVRRQGAGEGLGALYQDAQLAGGVLVPLGLSLPGVAIVARVPSA